MLNQLTATDRHALVVVATGTAVLFGVFAAGAWLGRSHRADETAPAPRVPVPAQPSPSTGWHLVEAGTYESAEVADQKVQSLRRQYTSARARQEPTDRLYHVYIGPYRQQDEANEVASEVRQLGFEAVSVRPVTPG